ncbi:MAG: PAS domain S-box protein [Candidatus Thiodiazotropha sp. (ex Epidulcina cf. delphinae)]|nr:PAS domain S-box protein [Candidatus Thiodiazotropha sp. (ex Epidulcina cf. delphinae)]
MSADFTDKPASNQVMSHVLQDMSDKRLPDQEIFEAVFEHHDAVMLLIEPDSGGIIKANTAAVRYYGYSRDQLEGMKIQQINTLSPAEIEADRMLVAREKRNYFIFPHRLQSGEIRQVEVHSSPIMFEQLLVLFSVIHDITDRQRAMQELTESEDRYHSLVEHINDGVMLYQSIDDGGDFVILDINTAGERITRFYKQQIVGKRVTEVFPGIRKLGLLEKLKQVYRTGLPQEIPKARYQDGNLDLWVKNYLYRLPNGEVVAIFEDLTGATHLQQALNRTTSTLADILDSMVAVVYVADMQTHELLYVNEYTHNLTGASAGDICWQTLQEGMTEPCEFCTNPILLKNRENHAEPYCWEYYNPKTKRWFSLIDSAVRWSDGRMVRLEIGSDITYLKQTELALRQSEERFELAMQGANDGLYDWDLKTNAVYYSPRWKSMLGYRDDELENTLDTWQRLVDPEDSKRSWQMLRDYMEGQCDNFQLEFRMRHKKGHWVDVLSRAFLVRDEQGSPIRVVGTHVDITERKRVEEELLSAQERQVLALELGRAFAFEWDPASDRVVQSASSMEILGLTWQQFQNHTSTDFFKRVHSGDMERFQEVLHGLAPGADSYRFQYRYLRGDGHWITLEDSARGFFNQDGTLRKLIGIAADVTDREEALEEIKRYQYIASASDDIMALVDSEYIYLTVNEAYSRVFNRPMREITGKRVVELWGEEQFKNKIKPPLDQALAGQQASFQLQKVFPAGNIVDLDVRYYPYVDRKGAIAGVVVHARDITKALRSANALRMNEERLNAMVELYRKTPELSESEILTFAVEKVQSITRSSVGYLHFVNEDQESLSFETWSQDTRSQCNTVFKSHYPVSRAGIWADAVRQGSPVIHNDYPAVRSEKGLPAGHVPLKRHMAVPILEEGATRLILGVGNKENLYGEDDVRQVRLIGETVWQLISRKRAERQLKQSAIVYETTREAVTITDADANILAVNRAFTQITGYNESEVIGRKPSILKSGRHQVSFYKEMWSAVRTEGQWQGEIWNRRKNGEVYPEWLSINSVLDDEGHVINYVGVFSDISQIKRSEEQLHYLAHFDPLTDLPNRLQLSNRLAASVARAQRLNHRLALLFIDIDHFKTINDSLGHPTGDLVLQAFSRRLRKRMRKEDFLARLGGDEFVILLEDCRRLDDAAYVAQDVIDTMRKPFQLEDIQDIYLGSSIGISLYPEDGADAMELIRNADTAMYRAKSEGRNTYRFYTEAMTQAANERLILESRLRRAIELDELSVYYQPLLNVMTQEIVGFEALVRWLDPDEGLILPDRFIPVAEETGSISAIGEWVLETACREVMDWRGKGGEPGILSVNLSGRQFHNQRLAMHVSDILDRSGMQASWLELEITESVLMELSEKTVRNLQELEKLGVRLSIDDFGTGYSSLAYLKRFKIDKLKIDQAFVRGVPGDASDVEITSTIIAMAKNLRIQVLAEGVENQQQLAFLQGQACDQYQGYYYSKPLPAGETLQLLLKGGVEDIPG